MNLPPGKLLRFHRVPVNRIRLLSEQVANQIAAGEVVDRPASVVKELVENALDADARRIVVEVGAGGRGLIRVTDDGTGMGRDDALMCLERHATSKIRRAEDLAAITTMGFRGEALPSIASVSRFTLTTRERGEPAGEGTEVVLHGGKIIHVRAAASPEGTAVEVRQLFYNLPARRKFLRSEETERAHILHTVTLAALAHPQVAFTLVGEGRPVWDLPAIRWTTPAERFPALRERLRQLMGADVPLLPVDATRAPAEEADAVPGLLETGEDDPLTLHDAAGAESGSPGPVPCRVWGFIGAPGVSRSNRSDQHLFVNQRPVENRGLNFALLEGYHTALMKGRYPVCCLFVEMDPAAVDVNVHPQKREVKFREEAAVRRWVAGAVREALLEHHRAGDLTPTAPAPPMTSASPPPQGPAVRSPGGPIPSAGFQLESPPSSPAPYPEQPPLPLSLKSTGPGAAAPGPMPMPAPAPAAVPHEKPQAPPDATPTPLLRVPLRMVGVVGRLYVVLESDRGLVLLDQHAAHERILFEQMLARIESGQQAPSQRLLLPETVELAPREAAFLKRHLEPLSRLGVGLREFGDRTYLLDALPPFVRTPNSRQFVTDLLDALQAAGGGVNTGRLGEDVVAKTVCRHAVKANDPLGPRELEQLVADLRLCAMPYTCPHGRPTLIEMNWRELEKKFGRTG